jgi:hypothetical protein
MCLAGAQPQEERVLSVTDDGMYDNIWSHMTTTNCRQSLAIDMLRVLTAFGNQYEGRTVLIQHQGKMDAHETIARRSVRTSPVR